MTETIVAIGGTAGKICAEFAGLCARTNVKQVPSFRYFCIDTDEDELSDLRNQIPEIRTVCLPQISESLPEDTGEQKPISTDEGSDERNVVREKFQMAVDHDLLSVLENLPEESLQGQTAQRITLIGSLCGTTASALLIPVAKYLQNQFELKHAENLLQLRGVFLTPKLFDRRNFSFYQRQKLYEYAHQTVQEFSELQTSSNQVQKRPLFDVCVLYDEVNIDGRMLRDLDDCRHHIAECIFTEVIESICQKTFDYEKQLRRGMPDGKILLVGFGTSVLRYPQKDVARYISRRALLSILERYQDKLYTFYEGESRKKEVPENNYADEMYRTASQRILSLRAICEDDVEELERRYSPQLGTAVRYICADRACLRELFCRADATLENSKSKHAEWLLERLSVQNVSEELILAGWTERIQRECDRILPHDVLSALNLEGKLKTREIGDGKRSYTAELMQNMECLAAPFVDIPLGRYQRELELVIYPKGKDEEREVRKRPDWSARMSLLAQMLPDEACSQLEMRVYRTVYFPDAELTEFFYE